MSKPKKFQQEFMVTPYGTTGDNRNECLGDTHRKTVEVGTSDRASDEKLN